jgi:hypothetical protein
VIVTNSGNADLTVTSVTASLADFGVTSNCTNSVPPGANCTIGVFFDPTASGTRTGTLTLTDNASDTPQTVTLTGTGSDFSMAPSGQTSATVTPGGTATYTLAIAPGGGFNQTVALACTGAPAGTTCALSSSSVALNGTTPTNVTVTVKTAASSASLIRPFNSPPAGNRLALWLAFPGLAAMVVLGSSTRRRRIRNARPLQAFTVLCLLTLAIACGGSSGTTSGGGGGTTPGTYSLAVTGSFAANGATLNHTTALTLVVQ